MIMIRRLVGLALAVFFAPAPFAASAELTLAKGDHICLVGNELGERMQHHNYWETLLHQQFPNQELVVRNLCFPGDEPFERIRSLNFGDPDAHLTHSKANVILYFFGFNESFAGAAGLESFADELTTLVDQTKATRLQRQRGTAHRLVSPIAFENTGDPNLPDGSEQISDWPSTPRPCRTSPR